MTVTAGCGAEIVREGSCGQKIRRHREVCVKVLVLGGGGQVARAVVACVPANHTVLVKTRQELDIADEAAVTAAVASSGAAWLVNGAGYTAVDLAEDQAAQAFEINDTAVGLLARAAS